MRGISLFYVDWGPPLYGNYQLKSRRFRFLGLLYLFLFARSWPTCDSSGKVGFWG